MELYWSIALHGERLVLERDIWIYVLQVVGVVFGSWEWSQSNVRRVYSLKSLQALSAGRIAENFGIKSKMDQSLYRCVKMSKCFFLPGSFPGRKKR